MSDVIIAGAARTPVGSFNGALAGVSAHYLGEIVIRELLARSGVAPEEVSEVILGQVLTAAQGQNPARQASINAGLPVATTAYGINQVCGSGLRAAALGFQAIRNGDSTIVIAGGQESMSQSAHAMHLRSGTRMGDAQMIYHDPRRLVGRLQRLSHGHHGRERRREVPDHPRGAG